MLCLSLMLANGGPDEQEQTHPIPVVIADEARIALTIDKSERRDGGEWIRSSLLYDVILSAPDLDGRRAMTWNLKQIDSKSAAKDISSIPSIEMTVDETLSPVSVDNVEEIVAAASRYVPDTADTGLIIQQLAATTPETAAALFAKDARLVAVGQGTDLYLGEDNPYEVEGAMPFGGAPITMIGSYRLHRYGAGVAEVRWSQHIDPASLAKAVPSLLRSMLEASGAKGADGAEFETKLRTLMRSVRIENSSECTAFVDTQTGLAIKTECNETVEAVIGDQGYHRERRLVATQRILD